MQLDSRRLLVGVVKICISDQRQRLTRRCHTETNSLPALDRQLPRELAQGYLPRNFAMVFDFGFIVDEVDAGWRLECSLRSRLVVKKIRIPISHGPAYAQADPLKR
jgi:hypothetical protein